MTDCVDYFLGFLSIAVFNLNLWLNPPQRIDRVEIPRLDGPTRAYTDDLDSDDDEDLLIRKRYFQRGENEASKT